MAMDLCRFRYVARIRKIISLHVNWLPDIEDELLGRRGRDTRCERIRQCRNYEAGKKRKNEIAGITVQKHGPHGSSGGNS